MRSLIFNKVKKIKLIQSIIIFNFLLLVGVFGIVIQVEANPQICGQIGGSTCRTLNNNDIWVLVGDSITSPHLYTDYLEAYYQLRYPTLHLHFRNEGRSGGNFTELATDSNTHNHCRYDRHVEPWSPDFVSILDGDNEGYVEQSIFANRLNTFIDDYIVGKSNAMPILFGPTPTYHSGGSLCGDPKSILEDYANEIVSQGQNRNMPYAKIWGEINTVFSTEFNKATPIPVINSDCTHPTPAGHLVVVESILHQIGAEQEVSSATINANTLTHSDIDCAISQISGDHTGITFDRLDNRLPMMWDDDATPGVEISHILDYNKYMLKITGLDSGQYYIKVNGVVSATVTATELQDGYNLTKMSSGPIYDKLINVLAKIRIKEGRDISFPHDSVQPWQGVRKFQSNADYQYSDQGLRGQDLKNALSSVIAEVNNYDNDIYIAATPEVWHFAIESADEGATCDSSHLNLCSDQSSCQGVGGNWCSGVCQSASCSTEIRADVDQNSSINSTDAMLTLRNSLGLDMSSTNWVTGIHTGDVNCDDITNSTDAMLILRKSLGLDMSGTGWCAE